MMPSFSPRLPFTQSRFPDGNLISSFTSAPTDSAIVRFYPLFDYDRAVIYSGLAETQASPSEWMNAPAVGH